jgi:PadR family transcriptional regulator
MARDSIDLIKGTLDMLVLKALSLGAMHGYGVSRWVREQTNGVLEIEDAALYQALHRLEKRDWIASEWGVSENNRRAKYYDLTPKGRRQLRTEDSTFRRYAEAVFTVLDASADHLAP